METLLLKGEPCKYCGNEEMTYTVEIPIQFKVLKGGTPELVTTPDDVARLVCREWGEGHVITMCNKCGKVGTSC